jgi:hypothetical protein
MRTLFEAGKRIGFWDNCQRAKLSISYGGSEFVSGESDERSKRFKRQLALQTGMGKEGYS